jgi:hypothetical protein
MCDCKQCQYALRINELFHEMQAARFNKTEFSELKIAEMKFLFYMLTGEHA